MSQPSAGLTQLLNQARVTLTGASDAALKGALYDVLDEFFTTSSVWMEVVPISILGDSITTTYDVVPSGGKIVRLAGVSDQNNFPQPALMPEIGVIQFAVAYSQAAVFTAVLVKSVALPVDKTGIPEVPQTFIDLYHYELLNGLLATMMMMPKKSFTDKAQAVFHYRIWRNGVNRARVAALRRNSIGSQAWNYPQSFATSGQRGGVSVGNDTSFGQPPAP